MRLASSARTRCQCSCLRVAPVVRQALVLSDAAAPMPKRAKLTVKACVSGRPGPSAVGAPPAKKNAKVIEEKGTAAFRFWTDARRFKGSEEKCIMQQALFESGGVRTGGYPKAAPIPGPLGCQRPSDWDLLWSPARLALKALPVKPGQLISAVPGLMSVTRKRKLSLTLKEAFGDDAFHIMPRTFSLPDELDAWRQYMAAAGEAYDRQEAANSDSSGSSDRDSGSSGGEAAARADGSPASTSASDSDPRQQLWILKTAQHLGKGLKLLPAEQAIQEAARNKGRSKSEKPYVQAQQYVANPLLIQGRKFGIRVWVLVTGHNPLRVYMHTNGLVLFSTHSYSSDVWSTDKGGVALGHVTNYAQNMDGMVWNLDQLQQHLGDAAYQQLWERISRNTAWVFSAALPHIQAQNQASGALPGSTFELLGLDYLVDTDLHPWLLEVNGTPSLAVEHENAAVEQLIHEQKMGMVRDMVSILNVRERFTPRYAAMRLAMAKQGMVSTAASANHASSSEAEDCAMEDAASDDEGQGVDGMTRRARTAAASEADGDGEASTGGASVCANNAAGSVQATAAAAVGGTGDSVGSSQAAAAAAQTSAARTALMRKRLREQMSPTGDAAVWRRVQQELQQCGDFQPLMSLFPVAKRRSAIAPTVPGPVRASPSVEGGGVSWDARDLDMTAFMSKLKQVGDDAPGALA